MWRWTGDGLYCLSVYPITLGPCFHEFVLLMLYQVCKILYIMHTVSMSCLLISSVLLYGHSQIGRLLILFDCVQAPVYCPSSGCMRAWLHASTPQVHNLTTSHALCVRRRHKGFRLRHGCTLHGVPLQSTAPSIITM